MVGQIKNKKKQDNRNKSADLNYRIIYISQFY